MAEGESYLVSIVLQARDQASTVIRGAGDEAKQAAANLRRVGAAMTAVGGMITGAMVMAGREAAGFESVMTDVAIQSGATAREMAELKKVALSTEFIRLGKSGTEVATMLRRLASEGYKVKEMREMLLPITETAIAMGTDEAETTKLMLNLMQQFRLSAEDMGHIGDVMVTALANTSYQGDELAETLKMAGVAGHALGWSLEDTIAVTDQIIKVTGEASMAGRYFRSLVMSMRAPTEVMAQEFARVGISLGEVEAALKDPIALIELLNKAHERGANFARMFSTVAVTAGEALVGQEEEVRKTIKALDDEGAAHDAAIAKMKTAVGQAQSFQAAMAALGTAIGEALLPAVRNLGPPLVTLTVAFARIAASPVGKVLSVVAAGIGGIMVAVGPLLIMLPQIAQSIKIIKGLQVATGVAKLGSGLASLATGIIPAVTGAAGSLGTVFATLAAAGGPIMLVVGALAVLAGTLYGVCKAYQEARKAAEESNAAFESALATQERAVREGYLDPEATRKQREAIEAARPTFGERGWGAITPGKTAQQFAQERVYAEQPVIMRRAAEETQGLTRATAAASDELAGHSLTTAAAAASNGLVLFREALDATINRLYAGLDMLTRATAAASDELAGHSLTTAAAAASNSLALFRDALDATINRLYAGLDMLTRAAVPEPQGMAVAGAGNTYNINIGGPVYGVDDLERIIMDVLGRAERATYYRL